MHMKNIVQKIFIPLLLLLVATAQAQLSKDHKLVKRVDGYITDAAAQYKVLQQNRPAEKFPKTYFPLTGKYEWSGSDWWCSGFYPGTLLYLYQQTNDTALYNEALRMLTLLEKEKYNTTTHDLGFMMYNSFGAAYNIAPSQQYKDIILASAKSLCTRFNPKTGCIKSWDSKKEEFLVIIDNMMNLELLFRATALSGDSSFYKIAVKHAETTMQNHFRADNSSWHVLNYDTATGVVKRKRTAQGTADSSAWARGQAWGLYGFTETYRETKDPRFLAQAKKIALFLMNHNNWPKDKVAYWDFNAPNIPNALRDASAAAIMASAFIELAEYGNGKEAEIYIGIAGTILKTLSGKTYRAAAGTNGGFILQHSVGNIPGGTEIDVPLTYADYYYIEALLRYKRAIAPLK